MKHWKKSTAVGAVMALVFVFVGAAQCGGSSKTYTTHDQAVTRQYAQKLEQAEPYPLAQMTDSAERANLREKLLRLNEPGKIGYVYELSQTGAVIAEYQIKGKVSSTNSQLTTLDQYARFCQSGDCNNEHFQSMGDDGSFGENEQGIFFFTTTGVLVEWSGIWQYSDAPLHLSTPPILTINANAAPSSTAGQLKK